MIKLTTEPATAAPPDSAVVAASFEVSYTLRERNARMRYVTRDGFRTEGATAADIIDGLRADSHTPGRDRSHFLEILARGVRLQTGAVVRTTDCEATLADLEQAGLIERLSDCD